MSSSDSLLKSLQKTLRQNDLRMSHRIFHAFEEVDRQYFVGQYTHMAYTDQPLPIPENQTISAPHMYVLMMADEIADLREGMDILEIGTGSGYGAALLARAVHPGKVVSIERYSKLVDFAKDNLSKTKLDFCNLELIHGDGTNLNLGMTFDRILVTAAGPTIPPSYATHLRPSGRIVMPLERNYEQWLAVIHYDGKKPTIDWKFRVRFVPLVGEFAH